MAERMKTLDENEAISSWSDSWRKTLRMVLIAACVGGIEFSYAAETALVSPLLLQLGVPVYLMTMTWCVSPLLGMVIVPILGSASDTCTSSMGRRRPFIIIYSVGVVFGLLLVPYGRNIGELLGDDTYSKLAVMAISDNNHTTISLMDNQTSFVNQTISAARDEHVPNHRIGIIFTIIGLMILDFCCDGCQIPSRTLMVDLTTDKDRTRGLSMFSVVAGAGGMVGYTLAGIGYHSQTSSGILDPLFFKHVHVVFGVVLGLYLLGSMLTVFGVSETPLNKKDSIHKYKRMYSEDGKDQISEHKLSESESSSSQNSYDRLKMTEMKEELGSTVTHIEETSELVSPPPEGSDEEKQLDQEETAEDMRVFLKTIINMPRYMWILCLTNLFSWMALVTFSLYYTDYVGQSVYGGSPLSPVGSEKRNIYDKGVRMGSLGMVAYSFSSCLFSFFLDKLINRFRTKIVYVGGLMTNCIGMAVMAATNNYIVAFIAPLTTGVLYTTTFTMPYILVSRYHSDKTLTPLKLEKGKIQKRGLGTDIAIVSSVVFVGQFTISAVIGVIIHAAGSTIMVPIVASILALCAAISASFVEYLDY